MQCTYSIPISIRMNASSVNALTKGNITNHHRNQIKQLLKQKLLKQYNNFEFYKYMFFFFYIEVYIYNVIFLRPRYLVVNAVTL